LSVLSAQGVEKRETTGGSIGAKRSGGCRGYASQNTVSLVAVGKISKEFNECTEEKI